MQHSTKIQTQSNEGQLKVRWKAGTKTETKKERSEAIFAKQGRETETYYVQQSHTIELIQ